MCDYSLPSDITSKAITAQMKASLKESSGIQQEAIRKDLELKRLESQKSKFDQNYDGDSIVTKRTL